MRVHLCETEEMWRSDGIAIRRFRYHAEPHSWAPSDLDDDNGVVLPRYGAFGRRSHGVEHIVDPNTGFFSRADDEVSTSNFTGEPVELTYIVLSPESIESTLPGADLPIGPFHVTPQLHLAHLELVLSAAHDDGLVEDHALSVVLGAVAQTRSPVIRGNRPGTKRTQRRLVSETCELLYITRGAISLREIARELETSPFHLSRIFREINGCTVPQYRTRVRVNEVLNQLASGCDDLASIAIATGFSDHSHMTRAVTSQLGTTPSRVRRRLRDLSEAASS